MDYYHWFYNLVSTLRNQPFVVINPVRGLFFVPLAEMKVEHILANELDGVDLRHFTIALQNKDDDETVSFFLGEATDSTFDLFTMIEKSGAPWYYSTNEGKVIKTAYSVLGDK